MTVAVVVVAVAMMMVVSVARAMAVEAARATHAFVDPSARSSLASAAR